MDIGFEHSSWQNSRSHAPATRAFAGDWSAAPEWLALQSRLAAAWSARQQMIADDQGGAQHCGSFDRGTARAQEAFGATFANCQRAVNPVVSANRKPAWGIAGHHAGDLTSGGRG